jgi:hypothetical protein
MNWSMAKLAGFGHADKIQLRLSEAGYLPAQRDNSTPPAGAVAALLVVREAGGQLHRKDPGGVR